MRDGPGVEAALSPSFRSQTGHRCIPELYISVTLHSFQAAMQVFITIAQLTFFRFHGLCVKVERTFS